MVMIVKAYYTPPDALSAIDQYHWEAITWPGENTPKDSVIYFFYGDIYDQDSILRNSKRFHYLIVPDDYASALNDQTVKRFYKSERPGDAGAGYPYWKAPLSVGFRRAEYKANNTDLKFSDQDICSFDYYIFDILPEFSRNPALIEYNIVIRELFIEHNMTEVFNNKVVSIVQNNNPGGDCIG